MKVNISDIIVKERIRKDPGDLVELSESMEKHGLFNPVTITDELELLAGYRRLMAAKKLGWEEIECKIINPASKRERFLVEVEENTLRKDFNEYEKEIIKREREYLKARGLRKLLLIIERLLEQFLAWLRSLNVGSKSE